VVDVLGRSLEQARALLEAAGYRVEVTETRTPRRVMLEGSLRVARQRVGTDGVVHLTVTHERYVPAARTPGD
jgi:hypothetical protein